MHKNKKASRIIAMLAAAVMMFTAMSSVASAAGYEDVDPGVYTVDASLSCFVTAMGGIEFGAPLLTKTTIEVKEDGTAVMTLSLQKSSVTIFGVTCDTFVDPNFQLGISNGSEWLSAAYTISDDTALNAENVAVNYVDSMTVQLPAMADSYALAMYVNSNVMGVQFGGMEGQTPARYNATLTMDWDSLTKVKVADETKTGSSTVNYTVTGGYEVKIPAVINVDSATKTGAYEVVAEKFIIDDGAYVTVTADTAGKVKSGSQELNFANDLAEGKLVKTGDKLAGTVTITDDAVAPGAYTGTLDFIINYYAQ